MWTKWFNVTWNIKHEPMSTQHQFPLPTPCLKPRLYLSKQILKKSSLITIPDSFLPEKTFPRVESETLNLSRYMWGKQKERQHKSKSHSGTSIWVIVTSFSGPLCHGRWVPFTFIIWPLFLEGVSLRSKI